MIEVSVPVTQPCSNGYEERGTKKEFLLITREFRPNRSQRATLNTSYFYISSNFIVKTTISLEKFSNIPWKYGGF